MGSHSGILPWAWISKYLKAKATFGGFSLSNQRNKVREKTSWDDDWLVKECIRGNPEAQKALFDRFAARMMGVCFRYVHNRADAEDIVQDGFIKVFHSLQQFQSRGSLEGWIRRIMVNTALNFLNKNKRLMQSLRTEDDFQPEAPERADGAVHQQDLLQMLQQLPEGYRTIINLYAIEGYSHKEIGAMLGIAEVTSRSQYSRGKELLLKIQSHTERMRVPDPKEKGK